MGIEQRDTSNDDPNFVSRVSVLDEDINYISSVCAPNGCVYARVDGECAIKSERAVIHTFREPGVGGCPMAAVDQGEGLVRIGVMHERGFNKNGRDMEASEHQEKMEAAFGKKTPSGGSQKGWL